MRNKRRPINRWWRRNKRVRLVSLGVLGVTMLTVGGGILIWQIFAPEPFGSAPFCINGKCCVVCPSSTKNNAALAEDPLVLDPLQFIGPAREAYIVAKQDPALLAKLHCYCGCDRVLGHKNLLDCYRDYHGASCEICTGEAMDAAEMAKEGSPVDQIRDALRARYAHREQ